MNAPHWVEGIPPDDEVFEGKAILWLTGIMLLVVTGLFVFLFSSCDHNPVYASKGEVSNEAR